MNRNLVAVLVVFAVAIGLFLIVLCVRPIFPGTDTEILFPLSGAVVPADFSVVATSTSWSLGLELRRPLGGPTSHAAIRGAAAFLSVDDRPYSRSSGGNHHVFPLHLSPGLHKLTVRSPFGEDSISVTVVGEEPVRFERLEDGEVESYRALVSELRTALSSYLATVPPPGEAAPDLYRQIYLADEGSFIFTGLKKEYRYGSCAVRYVAASDKPATAADILAAPSFAWDETGWPRPVKLSACGSCGDRFLYAVVDTESLTIYYFYPDGSVAHYAYPLSTISTALAEAIPGAAYCEIVVTCNRGVAVFRIFAGAGFHYAALRDGQLFPVKDGFTGSEAVILEDGSMVSEGGVAPDYATFDSFLSERPDWSEIYPPLPGPGEAYSFMAGAPAADPNMFYAYGPRFLVSPIVTGEDIALPVTRGTGGPVRFPPGIIESILNDRQGYFRVIPIARPVMEESREKEGSPQ